MTKKELAARLASKTGLSQKKAAEVLDVIFSADPKIGIIAEELNAGRKVVIPGFGTFARRTRAARTAINPSSGKPVTVSSRRYPSFKVSAKLRQTISDGDYVPVDPDVGPGVKSE